MRVLEKIRSFLSREKDETEIEADKEEVSEFDFYTTMTDAERKEFEKRLVSAFDSAVKEKMGVTFKDLAIKCAAYYTYHNAPMSNVMRKIKAIRSVQEDVNALTGGDITESIEKIETVIKLKDVLEKVKREKKDKKADLIKLIETVSKVMK